jgi:spermidine synthase
MGKPWTVVDSHQTSEGTLELKKRGERDYLITIGPQILMNSIHNRSELALGQMATEELKMKRHARVLVGGLGMGYTLRAILDNTLPDAKITVAELNPIIERWCREEIASLTNSAILDERVEVIISDVALQIALASGGTKGAKFDAIILDLYVGPGSGVEDASHPIYGQAALELTRYALKPGGTFAIWGEQSSANFEKRLKTAGFTIKKERPGKGGLRHIVYLASLAGRFNTGKPKRR